MIKHDKSLKKKPSTKIKPGRKVTLTNQEKEVELRADGAQQSDVLFYNTDRYRLVTPAMPDDQIDYSAQSDPL